MYVVVVIGVWMFITWFEKEISPLAKFTNVKKTMFHMQKHTVSTTNAPAAIGPYNQAVIYDQLVFCSGQIGLHPESGEMIGPDTDQQMRQVMKNLGEVLKASGTEWQNVLKCTIYLADMNDFIVVNDIYADFFPVEPPAREAVAVKTLPKNARVEVSCIAHR